MENSLKGAIYIGLGIFIIFLASDIIFKLALALTGLYFLYKGLQLRSANNILFHIHRFRNRF